MTPPTPAAVFISLLLALMFLTPIVVGLMKVRSLIWPCKACGGSGQRWDFWRECYKGCGRCGGWGAEPGGE